MSQNTLTLKFLGAAETVTGSRTLLSWKGNQFMVDCGLFQGPKELRLKNWDPFEYSKSLSAVILTHAHIDHSGFLPKLAKEGFRGPIYCSPGTKDLCALLLRDAAYLQEEDAKFANETQHSHHKPALPLYDLKDAENAIALLKPIPFHQWFELSPGLSFQFLRAGHILGASQVQISFTPNGDNRLVTFSGDLGNNRSYIMEPPEALLETDYLVLESTYGDRMQPRENPMERLALVINKVIGRQGTLIIPAFSVGRTQELLYMIQSLKSAKKIENVPVYLDSPMAEKSTATYLAHESELKKEIQGGDVSTTLHSAQFRSVGSTDDSMLLCMSTEPKIVISAAGMLTGGRVLHHLKAKLPDEKSGVLFVGYQAQGTKGLLLRNGFREIRIHHQKITVEAEIFAMEHLSAHADADDLLKWIRDMKRKPKLTLLNHGEKNSLDSLKYLIRNEFGLSAHIVKPGEDIHLT